jgi:hypothetical protein
MSGKQVGSKRAQEKAAKQARQAKAIKGCAPMTQHFVRAGQGPKVPRGFIFLPHTLVAIGLTH